MHPSSLRAPMLAETNSGRQVDGPIEGKVAVVIGAGQSPGEHGNGRATAIRFAQEGASVLAVDRNVLSARESLSMAGVDLDGEAFEADVTKSQALQAAVETAMARWGRIDILHYNVGVSVMVASRRSTN